MTVIVFNPTGIFDEAEADKLLSNVHQVLAEEVQTILIDYSEVLEIDTIGVGKLVQILKLVRRSGKELELCSVNASIRAILKFTELDQILTIHEPCLERFPKSA